MIELDKIYNEDCLEGMKRIPGGSVDAIICDLPYGVLNKGNEGGSWDTIIPFEPLWEQYLRVCKNTAAIVLFAQGMFTARLMVSQSAIWRYNLIWEKNNPTGFLNANRMPMRIHEDICVFYKELPTYNPQMEKCEPHQRNHGRGKLEGVITNRCYGNFKNIPAVISDEKFPKSIIKIGCTDKNKLFHPTQSPWICCAISSAPTPTRATPSSTTAWAAARLRSPAYVRSAILSDLSSTNAISTRRASALTRSAGS